MNATHDDQSDEPKEPGLPPRAEGEAASPGLTRNKSEGLTPGEILREGRLAHDYTVEDLCAQTRLSRHTIDALEENDFQALSQPVFARGYYRQCAKVLDLNVDRLMAAYTALVGEEAPKPRIDDRSVGAGIIPQDVTPGGGFRFRGLLILVLIVAAVVAAIAFVLPSTGVPGAITGNSSSGNAVQPSQPDQNTKSFEFNSSSSSNSNGGSGASSSDTTTSSAGTSSNSSGGGSSNASKGGSGTNSQGAVATGAANTVTPSVVGGNSGSPLTGKQPGGRNVNQSLGLTKPSPAGHNAAASGAEPSQQNAPPAVPPNRLVLKFNKRSWVRVTDANGDRMASGIFQSGDTKEFNGTPPYKITLGYAPGVKVTIGGKPVDVAGHTSGGGIAHLTVNAPDNANGNG
ncbi:RodZ domain-containing protein [Salinisphaera sp. LB1]|uniref:helix-turn-helix domain-containing protein n=1 Tax=Salinisphaera sp. LB1 TaxID=2183911 RepID=UPI000D707376|nr:RodZ domain-containing protein [Salinisphaera sp. LB1]AWN17730.1 putative membrane protein [Salinisphaera sp. LB1]